MARQEVNIGVEGNDGTGDSIRESFRKTNENFAELYAVFGQGGTIRFTTLDDTPSELSPNTVALVNDAGTAIQLAELASNSALDENATDTITFSFDSPGKLVISTAFTKVADDLSPSLGGSLYANNKGIAGVAITPEAAEDFLADHGVSVSVDDLVITKGYADRRYITSANVGLPIRIEEEPAGVSQYTFTINRYVSNQVEVLNHGYDSGINGTAYKFNAEDVEPTNLTNGQTVYIRFLDENNFTLHTTEAGAASEDSAQALATRILVEGTITGDDVHTLTDAAYDSTLAGNFLDNVAVPRKSLVRRQGDTLEGALYLSDHPGELAGEGAPNGPEDLQAATKYYVDNTSYSSPTNLFVSTKGDDTMAGVPNGKEGTSLTYAFRTINKAAQRAAEIVRTAPAEPGPYFQTITKDNGDEFADVTVAEIDNPVYTPARTLINDNRDYIVAETRAFLAFTFPDFVYDIDICDRDTGLILDSIALDINRGLNANFLTRRAAERYYSNSSGRKAITSQLTETVAAINFAKGITNSILANDLYQQKIIDSITRASPAVVTTTTNHGLVNKNQVIFKDIGGMTQIEGVKTFAKVISDQVIELYEDEDFTVPYDTTLFDGYTTGGKLGLIFQTDEDQQFTLTDADVAARSAVGTKFDLVVNIISNGIDAGADIVFGSNYKVVLNNGSQSNVDQGDPDNTDILPGKVIVGERSGAIARIVQLTVNDGTEDNNDTIQCILLEPKDFEVGEPIKYGNFVKKKQVTIFIESGFYEEDYPIKLANNVSIKGDEFRRVIIRPKDRVSQSPYAQTYFFRDKEFDGLDLALEGEPFYNQVGALQGYFGYHYLQRADRPINIGSPITNPGGYSNASAILKENKEFIQNEVIAWIADNQPSLTYDEAKCRRDTGLILDAVALDVALGTNHNAVTAGLAYQRASATETRGDQKDATVSAIRYAGYLVENLNAIEDLPNVVIRVRNAFEEVVDILDNGQVSADTSADAIELPSPTGVNQDRVDAKDQLQANLEFAQAEAVQYITNNYPAEVYTQTIFERDVKHLINALSHDALYGGNFASITNANGYFYDAILSIDSGVSQSTLAATYTFLDTLLQDIIQGNTVTPLQGTVTQDTDSGNATATEASDLSTNINYVISSITAGNVSGLPSITLPSITWADTDYQSANSAILSNKSTIQDDVITFINDNFVSFTYNEAKCRRDTGLIVDALALDVKIGGEENTLEAQGQYYYNYISKYDTDGGFLGQEAITRDALSQIGVIGARLMTGTYATGDLNQNPADADYIAADVSLGAGESGSGSLIGNLVDKIVFAFEPEYNPPKRNNQMDVFLMSDATICRNVTVQGHGGFMCVLDPEGQVLTKSPYIQTASSFSESIDRKRFAGGMYVDAFVGNIPAYIPETIDPGPDLGGSQNGKISNFVLWIRSTPGQGLFIRPPELPCPFYVEGRRYQVNAISDYDSGNGWCKIYLDAGSNNGAGYDETQFSNGEYYRDIFLQTAGNRSMLANDFTQINDLGYGLVVNNGAFSEQVSTFTYYCQAAFYANNGSEIRSLNGSNGYGNFGLVAEGADPNEIPDQVVLRDPMVQPARAFTTPTYTNAFDEPSLYVTDMEFTPTASSLITIDHPTAGRLNYVIQTVTTISDSNGDGVFGDQSTDVIVSGIEELTPGAADASRTPGTYEDITPTGAGGTGATFDVVIDGSGAATISVVTPGSGYTDGGTVTFSASDIGGTGSDLTATVTAYGGTYGSAQPGLPASVHNNIVYKLDLRADDIRADDFFGTLQQTVENGTLIEYRNDFNHIFGAVIDPGKLVTRPSTAINFDESDDTTYRSTAFAAADALGQDLPANQVATTFEVGFDFVELEVDTTNISGGYGSAQGDTQIAITNLEVADAVRITRDIAGLQPGDPGYAGGMLFAYDGKTHQVTDYDDSGAFPFITISDVAGTNLNSGYAGSGINSGLGTDPRIFQAGLQANATAEITIAISLTRATGHDFTQIGTGGYNDTNYPNVILGDPENSLAEFYTDSSTATTAQVWERRKGRVFFVSTDQFGFFRVGKFFSVDQATGDITFAGEIGLSNANSLGFKRGVTINEFSADDSMADESGTAVPTEKAIVSYLTRRLGWGSGGQVQPSPTGNRIGPGFLTLNGATTMEGDIDMGSNKVSNLALPGTDGTAAANKNYVDSKVQEYDEFDDLRNVELNNIAQNDLLVASGKKRIFIELPAGGTFNIGDTINEGLNTGTIVDIEQVVDNVIGTLADAYNVQIITYTETAGTMTVGNNVTNGTATSEILDGPIDEITNASEASTSDINVTVTRAAGSTEFDFQIEPGAIENADVSATAAISQSKLAMNTAGTRANATGIAQSDLGLATFKNTEFTETNGFVELFTATSTVNGIPASKLQHIPTDSVLGRTDAGDGAVSAISFANILTDGGAITDGDLPAYTGSSDQALIRTGAAAYSVNNIATGSTASTIAKRDINGKLQAESFIIGGDSSYEILSASGTTLSFKTPGQATILTAQGTNSDTLVVDMPGILDVGETGITAEGNFQSNASSYAGEGFVTTDWVYTKFIEANDEMDNASTGISLGANTGFANSAADTVITITGGSERLIVSDATTTVTNNLEVDGSLGVDGSTTLRGNVTLGDAAADLISVNGRLNANVLPSTDNTVNLGQGGGTPLRFNTVHAVLFSGTATTARYADLAEKYTADANYEPGTVVVFGGDAEVTACTSKGQTTVAGVISTNPAYLMNSELEADNAVEVALMGRVPCKVIGKVRKGDMLVTSAIPGYAIVNNNPSIGTVLGKAIDNKDDEGRGTVEIAVGKV